MSTFISIIKKEYKICNVKAQLTVISFVHFPSIPENYRLGMHVFGLLACCDNLKDMDDVVHSAAIVFCSPCSGRNVTKHYNNLKILMQKRGTLDLDEKTVIAEDYKVS